VAAPALRRTTVVLHIKQAGGCTPHGQLGGCTVQHRFSRPVVSLLRLLPRDRHTQDGLVEELRRARQRKDLADDAHNNRAV
jgi:hypothetical protein